MHGADHDREYLQNAHLRKLGISNIVGVTGKSKDVQHVYLGARYMVSCAAIRTGCIGQLPMGSSAAASSITISKTNAIM